MSSAEFAAEELVLLLPCWRPFGVTVVTGDFAAATIKKQGIAYARAGIRVRCLLLLREGAARFGLAPAGSQHSIRAAALSATLVPILAAWGACVARCNPRQLAVTALAGAVSGYVPSIVARCDAAALWRPSIPIPAVARVTAPLVRVPCRGCCARPVSRGVAGVAVAVAAGRVITGGPRPAGLAVARVTTPLVRLLCRGCFASTVAAVRGVVAAGAFAA
jgi:hypothetical protein